MAKVIAWTDVESAGTSSDLDAFLEVAVVFTDFLGEIIAEPYSSLVTVKNLNRIMKESDPLVQEMHDKSGLWSDLWSEKTKRPEVIDEELQDKLTLFTNDEVFILGGNSPTMDRRFVELYLPGFYKKISHRSVDVTTLSMVFQESSDAQMFVKRGNHRALPDVLDSIEEYRHYLHWLNVR